MIWSPISQSRFLRSNWVARTLWKNLKGFRKGVCVISVKQEEERKSANENLGLVDIQVVIEKLEMSKSNRKPSVCHRHQPGTSSSVTMVVVCFLAGFLVVVGFRVVVVVVVGFRMVKKLPGKLKSPPCGTVGWKPPKLMFQLGWLVTAPRSMLDPPFWVGRAIPFNAWSKIPVKSSLIPASSCLPPLLLDDGAGIGPAGRLSAVSKLMASFWAENKIQSKIIEMLIQKFRLCNSTLKHRQLYSNNSK